MDEISDYKVIEAKTSRSLTSEVNKYIDDGYILIGGVSVACSTLHGQLGMIYAQAVAKRNTSNDSSNT